MLCIPEHDHLIIMNNDDPIFSSLLTINTTSTITSVPPQPMMSRQLLNSVVPLALLVPSFANVDYSCLHSTSWFINENGDFSDIFSATTDITQSSLSGKDWATSFNKIPKYDHVMTSGDIAFLNSRPEASSDFSNGETSAKEGETYAFGTDIGYISSHCGLGWWPPGPQCPSVSASTSLWSLSPAPETRQGGCYTPMLGSIGSWVNGVSIFGASDGQSYNNKDVWHNSAVAFEYYDLDQCNGHAANGEYHHHHMPVCIQERLQDDGSKGHSPIYGWLKDGYPMHGPYQAANTLASSCWKTRDYAATSATGCSDGTRSCQLVDPYDYTQGTITSSSGPSLDGTVTTQSGNTLAAGSGIFREDYYFDSSCSGGGSNEFLDSFNGHDHDDLGYHYHVTIDSSGAATYPYMAGPKYYGCMSSGECCSTFDDMQCRSASSTCGASEGAPSSSQKCSSAVNPLDTELLPASSSGRSLPLPLPPNPLAVPLIGTASSPSKESGSLVSGGVAGGGVAALVVAVGMFSFFFRKAEPAHDHSDESEAPFLLVENEA